MKGKGKGKGKADEDEIVEFSDSDVEVVGTKIACTVARCKEKNPSCLKHMGQEKWLKDEGRSLHPPSFGPGSQVAAERVPLRVCIAPSGPDKARSMFMKTPLLGENPMQQSRMPGVPVGLKVRCLSLLCARLRALPRLNRSSWTFLTERMTTLTSKAGVANALTRNVIISFLSARSHLLRRRPSPDLVSQHSFPRRSLSAYFSRKLGGCRREPASCSFAPSMLHRSTRADSPSPFPFQSAKSPTLQLQTVFYGMQESQLLSFDPKGLIESLELYEDQQQDAQESAHRFLLVCNSVCVAGSPSCS
jgi:hypothetical protein